MFAEIVPEQLRSAVYAFDRSFEGAVGATAAPLVGEQQLPPNVDKLNTMLFRLYCDRQTFGCSPSLSVGLHLPVPALD